MGVLRKASAETTQLKLDETDFLVVRQGVSKRDFRSLLDKLPDSWGDDSKFTPGQMDDFSTALFEMLVVGWSLPDECTVDDYQELDRAAAAAVDAALIEHFNGLTPSTEVKSKSKGNSK